MKRRIKAARTLLGISQVELCEYADIPLITLRRVEGKGDHTGLVSQENVERIKRALEAHGIQFLENGEVAAGPGVSLNKGRDD